MSDKVTELALAAAADLSGDLGFDVKKATKMEINGEQPEDATRAFGIPEAMAISSFLMTAAQFAWTLYRTEENKAVVLQKIVAGVEKAKQIPDENLAEEKRLQIIGAFVNRMMPDSAEAIFHAFKDDEQDAVASNKNEWIKQWEQAGWGDETTQKTASATVLLPFADMKYYALYEPKTWYSPENAPAQLPSFVSAQKGFVTDLASIPRFFWWLVPPMGRYAHAAISHDWLYWQQTTSRRVADQVFDEIMKEYNVDPMVRTTIWASVRLFGGKYWNASTWAKRRGERNVISKFPDSPHYTWEEWKKQPGVFA